MLSYTAADARLSAPRTATRICEDLLVRVKEMALDGRTKLRTGYDYYADTEVWIRGGYNNTTLWQDSVKLLEEAGFYVRFFYEERQFVDMYTLIEW